MVVGDSIVLNPGCGPLVPQYLCASATDISWIRLLSSKCSLKSRRIIRVKCLSVLTSFVLCKIKVACSKDLWESLNFGTMS